MIIFHVKKCNTLLLQSYQNSVQENLQWPLHIKNGLSDAGLGFIWNSSLSLSPKGKITHLFLTNLQKQFLNNNINAFSHLDSKLNLFGFIRQMEGNCFPSYLLNENKILLRIYLSKFRLSDHDLLVEVGRYEKIP